MLALDPWMLYALLALAGVVIGLAASFTGLGGGALMVALLVFAGMPAVRAVGTSFLAILVISGSALFAHARLKHVNVRLGLLMGGGGAIGAQFGARFLTSLREPTFRVIFACVLLSLAAYLTTQAARARRQPVASDEAPRGRKPASGGRQAMFALLGLLIGGAAALTGLGGGFLMVPVAMLLGLGVTEAVGTSFVGILIISTSALLAHAQLANVEVGIGLAFGAGGVIGAQIGARLVHRVSQRLFKAVFAAVLLVVAGRMLIS